MKILITGATGFIGQKLFQELFQKGHEIVILSRDPKRAKKQIGLPCEAYAWNPSHEPAPPQAFQGVDAVFHLLGESVAAKRWSDSQKKEILESRTLSSQNLFKTIQSLGTQAPSAVISASATGFYGDRGDLLLNEDVPAGTDFLAQVCTQWESATLSKPELPSIRRVAVRIGMVLDSEQGAMEKILPLFRKGLGGRLGRGTQWMSWIWVDDLIRLFVFILENKTIQGAVNAVSPQPVTNIEFTRTLADSIKMPAFLPAPKIALQTILGEMATLLLASQKVTPARALRSGFEFQAPDLSTAFAKMRLSSHDQVFMGFQWISSPPEKVFPFFSEAKNLETLTPPFLNFKILDQSHPNIQKDFRIQYQLKFRGVPIRWKTHITEWDPPHAFMDIQEKGPFKKWEHLHSFLPVRGGTLMIDRVYFQSPFNFPVRSDVEKIFSFRREKIESLFP